MDDVAAALDAFALAALLVLALNRTTDPKDRARSQEDQSAWGASSD